MAAIEDTIKNTSLGQCRSCGTNIRWIVTQAGKPTPVDAKGVTGYVGTAVTDQGNPVGRVAAVYLSHFATCPSAEKWRK